ncbi:MAG: hypothetical protein ABFC95_00750 [Smithella sp.]
MGMIFSVLKNKRAWKRFCRKEAVYNEPEPKQYPCAVDDRMDGHGESYLRYYYLRDIEKCRNKLIKMGG